MVSHKFSFHTLSIAVDDAVYDPAEDTFLLLDALPENIYGRILEIGTGCGIIGLECARRGGFVVCTDILSNAYECARKNIENNRNLLSGTIEVRHGDLFSVLNPDERFDIIVMNPPYLPIQTNRQIDPWLSTAVESGQHGLDVILRFVVDCTKHLTSHGQAFVVVSSFSKLSWLNKHILNNKLDYTIVKHLAFTDEQLYVYKLNKREIKKE